MNTLVGESRSQSQIAISIETLVYLVTLLVALLLRGIDLGNPPLASNEAAQAIAALRMTTKGIPSAGLVESPLLFGAMTLGFALAGPTDAVARALPMITGVLLVLIPLMFRHRLGRGPALIAAILIAVSPIAVAASRQVDSTGTALLALLLCVIALDRHIIDRTPLSLTVGGAALGIALVSDVTILLPLISLFAGLGFAILTDEEQAIDREQVGKFISNEILSRGFLLPLIAAVLLFSTLFFLSPQGMAAIGDQLTRFATGFVRRDPSSPWVGIVLVGYAGGVLLFGVIGGWLASQSSDPWWRAIAGWGTAATILVLAYPDAHPLFTLWAVVPLSLLAGAAVTRLFETTYSLHMEWASWSLATLAVTLSGAILSYVSRFLTRPSWYPLALGTAPEETINISVDLIIAFLLFGILVVLWLTVASFWGQRSAYRGLGIGFVALMLMSALGRSGTLAFAGSSNPYQMLRSAPAQPGLILFAETAQSVSTIAVGEPQSASITAQVAPDGIIAWALRDYSNTEFVSEVDPSVNTAFVVTLADSLNPTLGSAYVGQDFIVTREWLREDVTLENWLRWIIYQQTDNATIDDRAILWVREDIYLLNPEGDILP